MPVPKKRTSASKRDMRRSHDSIKPTFGIVCSNCGIQVVPHRVCSSCGYYKGKQVTAAAN